MLMKNKQWIYSLIALIILILGMCVEKVRADSVFACESAAPVVSYVEASEDVISELDVCLIETLDTRNMAGIRQIANQASNGRKELKLSMVFLCVAAHLLLLSNFYTTSGIVRFPELNTQVVVLNYIHNTDGKKRI